MRYEQYPPFKNLPRHLLLLEEWLDGPTTSLPCWLSTLVHRPGFPSPPSRDHWSLLKPQLWETESGWPGVLMMKDPPDLRWWRKSDDNAHCTFSIKIMIFKQWMWWLFQPKNLLVRCLNITPNHGTCGWGLEIFNWNDKAMLPFLLGLSSCPACQVKVIINLKAEGLWLLSLI